MADISSSVASKVYSAAAFPLARQAWEAHGLAASAPERRGRTLTPSGARRLADQLIKVRLRQGEDVSAITAGRVMALDLLHGALRHMTDVYCGEQFPGVLDKSLHRAGRRLSPADVTRTLRGYAELYPPAEVLEEHETLDAFLGRSHAPYSASELTARECLLLHIAMFNRAARPFQFLFDDAELKRRTAYEACMGALEQFFREQPPFPLLDMPLLKVLRAPIEAAPDSLEGQLDYVREHWGAFLPAELKAGLLLARDIIREETALRGWGPGPIEVLRFGAKVEGYPEPEAFSKDVDWMSNVVLMAKSTHVWLHQLSRAYARDIQRLDQIPDEELDRLARWGFTSLWLIGLWERSPASRQIKQMTGNPEALASAYSLYDYEVAHDLGGHAAYENLRDRAWRRGIRLASDMVPNHMGVYSKWIVEHPDWFVQLTHPPYPGYSFTGVDLSQDERVCIQIEGGYWDQRDAAVVFRRLDKWTGEARYIYHGNDGTSTPWNDTAQLNFLLPQVREAVVQTILHVARMFPVIRFDAAMTLAKRHFQRLWFPQPGDAGAIPSRAEHGMSKEAFDAAFPKEFWREVVDRIAEEAPDTLLLAEAFWLMEGYFVRTLGMHRVYNSAFMNMLKMEENSKYRQTVKNVLEFSPEVLKRFVNFMNNPDERTAVEQFGKGDKYCGAALMMVTMPGLPMFGHGQIEGFTEKYGMEYGRAYYDESVDEHLVYRHETEIFPLMRRRRLFSGVENFALYDFETNHGWVDENVFAYSNRAGGERALIAYNNAYNNTSGWIRRSTAVNVGSAETPNLISRSLADALALNVEANHFYVFGDHRSGLEFIREGSDLAERGMFVELGAYQYHAFIDFREVFDGDGSWRRLAERLNGAGVPDMFIARREMELALVLEPWRALMNGKRLKALAPSDSDVPGGGQEAARQDAEDALTAFLDAAMHKLAIKTETGPTVEAVRRDVAAIQDGDGRVALAPLSKAARAFFVAGIPGAPETRAAFWREMAAWALVRRTGAVLWPESAEAQSAEWMDDWLLRNPVQEALEQAGEDPRKAEQATRLLRLVLRCSELIEAVPAEQRRLLTGVFEDHDGRAYLNLNSYEGVVYFQKEAFETLLHRSAFCRLMSALAEGNGKEAEPDVLEKIEKTVAKAAGLMQEAEGSGYSAEALLERLAPKISERGRPAGSEAVE